MRSMKTRTAFLLFAALFLLGAVFTIALPYTVPFHFVSALVYVTFTLLWALSIRRRSTFPGPMRCVWPANSSSVRGRSRDASGWETSVSNKDICSIIIFYYPYILTSNLTILFRQCYFTTRAVFATADDQRAAQTPETAGTVKACPQGGEC